MELARWLVVFVASVTAIGGLMADYFVPSSGAKHIRNPRWPPHAKFHNAQGILVGFALGVGTNVLLFLLGPLSVQRILLSALLASIYWLCIFAAPVFLGTAFSDPEFASTNPSPMGVHAQLFIGFVLVSVLLAAVCVMIFTKVQHRPR